MTFPWPTLSHLVAARARETPAAHALRFEGGAVTCGELHEASGRLAAVLLANGVRPGDRVALLLPNEATFPVSWLGIVRAGAVVVPVDMRARPADLGHLLRNSGATAAIVAAEVLPTIRPLALELPHLRWVGTFGPEGDLDVQAAMRTGQAPAPLEALDPTAIASIQYTSGTTGLPKGCVLGHDYWLHFGTAAQAIFGLGSGDVALTAQPFNYVDPMWNLVMGLIAGVPLVVLPRFSASTFWKRVGESGATYFYCLGTMPHYLMRQPADARIDRGHKVRMVYCSGIDPAAHAAFEERWGAPWREAYGSTELGVVLAVPPGDASSVGTGDMGRLALAREVRVIDNDGDDVPDGMPGELVVRGPHVMRGYFDNPDATSAWMPADGWARTGDLVIREANGTIRIVGRKKEMIRRGGENIAAVEVETVLMQHPGIQLAACVPEPDPLRGEEVKAFVQLASGWTAETLPPAEIRWYVQSQLAAFKAPRYVVYVTAMPFTPSERVAKAELMRQATDGRWPVHDAAPDQGSR